MNENIFYESLDIRSPEPIDKRLYIDELTNVNLSALFSNGRYGFENNVLFNKTDKKFYYLSTKVTDSDVINPSNWVAIESSSSSFSLYVSGNTYSAGSCVYEIDGGSNKRFFIGKENIASGENPLNTSSKWFEVKSSSAVTQKYYYRLDPDTPSTYTFQFNLDSTLKASGNLPVINAYVDLGERESTNIIWEKINPEIKVYESTNTVITITFLGDVSDFHYNDVDTTQTNILIEIR